MKIIDVKAVYPNYQHIPPSWRTHFWQIVVRVESDAGVTGYGYGGGGVAAVRDEAVSLQQAGRADELVRVPPEARARRRAACAQNALVHAEAEHVDIEAHDRRDVLDGQHRVAEPERAGLHKAAPIQREVAPELRASDAVCSFAFAHRASGLVVEEKLLGVGQGPQDALVTLLGFIGRLAVLVG